jgi:hypothetical protein
MRGLVTDDGQPGDHPLFVLFKGRKRESEQAVVAGFLPLGRIKKTLGVVQEGRAGRVILTRHWLDKYANTPYGRDLQIKFGFAASDIQVL